MNVFKEQLISGLRKRGYDEQLANYIADGYAMHRADYLPKMAEEHINELLDYAEKKYPEKTYDERVKNVNAD